MSRRILSALAAISALTLAACSGGGSSTPATVAATTVSNQTVQGSATIAIPTSASASAATRKALFVSPSAASVVLTVNGGTPATFDISSKSTNCTTVQNLRTCTLAIAALAGTASVTSAIWDGANGTGVLLGNGSGTASVTIGTPFTVAITLNPVVASATAPVITYVSGSSFTVGTPSTATVVVAVKDPGGNAIPASTASFATPVTLVSSDAHVTVSPASWTGATQSITLTYDGSSAVGATVQLTINAGTVQLVQGAVVFATSLAILEYPVPTAASLPEGIVTGPDNALWFVEANASKIGRFDPFTRTVTGEYPTLSSNAAPTGIAVGSDGALWFTEQNPSANRIGRIDPTTHVVTEFTGISAAALPFNIAAGPDNNLWFTEFNGTKIGRITPTGVITEFSIPTSNSNAYGIAAGGDGAMWFTESNSTANKIGRITVTGSVTELAIPTSAANPQGITLGPDGAMWFTENSSGANKIGRIAAITGPITEFVIPTAISFPQSIATGPDGALWFTENSSANKIGRMTTAGVFTETAIPTASSQAYTITPGADGAMWFTERASAANKIGRIQ